LAALRCVLFLTPFAWMLGPLRAAPWVIVTDFQDSTIHTIDLGTNPPTVYGPFLQGQVVAASHLGAVKVIPGDQSALLAGAFSNMWRLDIANPKLPFVTAFTGVDMQVFGLAVSRDGRFAVAAQQVIYAILDLRRSVASGSGLPYFPYFLASVAIAPNDSTVVFADLAGNRLFYGDVNSDLTGFLSLSTVDTVSAPRKVAIAPDGQTVLVGANDLEIYRLTGDAGLVRGTPPTLPVGAFSFAFEPSGNRVYALSAVSTISILRVEAPGVVNVEAANAVTIPTSLGPPSPGIDMLGITPDGQRLVVGDSLDTYVHVVRLSDLSLSAINTGGKYPTGIDVFQGVSPEPTTTPTPTSTPTPTATPGAIAQVAVPTLSSRMLVLLALTLGVLALRLLHRP
jgi:hypothetical protein